MSIEDIPCPRCEKPMSKHLLGSHYYYYCQDFGKGGCNTIYADDPDCYFGQIYIITPQGELVGYKGNGGHVTRTKKFLPEFWGREIY